MSQQLVPDCHKLLCHWDSEVRAERPPLHISTVLAFQKFEKEKNLTKGQKEKNKQKLQFVEG